jgi:hypothetical protein
MRTVLLISFGVGAGLFLFAVGSLFYAGFDHQFDLPFRTVRFAMCAGIVLLMLGSIGLVRRKDHRGFEVKLTTGTTPVIEKNDETTHG